MSRPDRSISQRLQRAKSPEARRDTLTEWAEGWEREQRLIGEMAVKAFTRADDQSLSRHLSHLEAMTSKRFMGLKHVIEFLTEGNQP